MGKDSGDSVETGGIGAAAKSMNDIGNRLWTQANRLNDFGEQMLSYGMGRTAKYADPVLNEFLRIMGFGGTPVGGDAKNLGIGATSPVGGYVSPTESALFQNPAWQTQQSTDQAKQNILRNTKPGPQQTALLADADNKRSANLGTSAFSQVQGMLNSLLSMKDEAWKGAQMDLSAMGGATSAFSGAASAFQGSGNLNQGIANMQSQAQQSGNSMLGGIFSTIGTLGGMVLGGPIGGALGGMIGSGVGNAAGGGGTSGLPAYNPSTSAYGDFGLGSSLPF